MSSVTSPSGGITIPIPSSSTNQNNSTTLLQHTQWKHPELIARFLADDYDETAYMTMSVLDSSSHLLSTLSALSREIDDALATRVMQHHTTLLQQTTQLTTVETKLQLASSRIRSLIASMTRIRTSLLTPYTTLSSLTCQLSNVQRTCETVRACSRVHALLEKLKEQVQSSKSGGAREIAKAAQSLYEIETVLQESDLTGIHVIDTEMPFINEVGTRLRAAGARSLIKGCEALNQSEVGSALQVFYNLGATEMITQVDATVDRIRESCVAAVRRACDVASIGEKQPQLAKSKSKPGTNDKTKDPSATMATTWRTTLWDRMETLSDTLFTFVQQVWTLQRVLFKKRDPATHVLMATVYSEKKQDKTNGEVEAIQHKNHAAKTLVATFWSSLCTSLTSELESTGRNSSFIKNIFINEYPRLSHIFNHLHIRITQPVINESVTSTATATGNTTAETSKQAANILGPGSRRKLMQALASYEQAYLARSLSRLNEPVNLMFASSHGSVPSKSDVGSYLTVVHEALQQIRSSDVDLQSAVIRGISKSLLLFSSHCERMVRSEVDRDVISQSTPISPIQRNNSEVFACLCQVQSSLNENEMKRMYPDMQTAAISILTKSLASLTQVHNDILSSLITSITRHLDTILLTMMDEDWSQAAIIHPEGSPYMENVRRRIQHMVKHVLPLYQSAQIDLDRQKIMLEHLTNLTSRLITIFLRTASCISPLTEQGRLKLTGDMAQLESILHLLVPKRKHEGGYTPLIQYKEMLFQPDILTTLTPTQLLHRDIEPYTLLTFLFSSTTGLPTSTSAPHRILHIKIDEYVMWIDTHHTNQQMVAWFTKVYERLESKISIPKGPEGVHYIRDKFPRLALVTQILAILTAQSSQS